MTLEPPPSPSTRDRLAEIGRSLVGEAPGGGVLVELYRQWIGVAYERRWERWMTEVYELLVELDRRGIDLDALAERPAFVTAVHDATRIALGEHLETKLELLQGVLLNAAISEPDRVADVLTLRDLRWIDELEPEHIVVLRYFDVRPLSPRQADSMSDDDKAWAAAYRQLDDDVRAVVGRDLETRGLLVGQGIKVERTVELHDPRTREVMPMRLGDTMRGSLTSEPLKRDLSNGSVTEEARQFLRRLPYI